MQTRCTILALGFLASPLLAQGYPDNAGFVDVTKAPYSAVGDGKTDDTAAIQRAISENAGRYARGSRTIYFPAGTYLVSGTLDWRDAKGRNGAHLTLQGAGRDKTTIRLADQAPGFSDPQKPRAVIYTRANHNPEWYRHSPAGEALGEGHVAFHNNIFDLTVDTGSGNPGAIGIDYHSNNQGTIANVDVRSGDGLGVCAFELTRRNVGPSLLENVRSTGFDNGIRFAGLYCLTIQGAEVKGAKSVGLSNAGGVVSARGLVIEEAPVAVSNTDPTGLVNLLDSRLVGSGPNALAGQGKWLVIRTSITGFARAAEGPEAPGLGEVGVWTSGPQIGPLPSDLLPVADVPAAEPIAPDEWADVTSFGARPNDFEDDSAAIQAALDSGKPGVLFPFSDVQESRYLLTRPIVVPPSVRRIAGGFSNLFAIPGPAFPAGAQTPLVSTSGEGGALVMDRIVIRLQKDLAPDAVALAHRGSRPFVLRHALLNGFQSSEGSGPLFLVDVSAHASDPQTFDFAAGTKVWAWQLDAEDWSKTKLTNRGASLWILGLKTERPSTVLDQLAGRSEIYGGLFYQHHAMDPSVPALRLRSGALFASFATTTGGPATQPGYEVLLQDDTQTPPVVVKTTEKLARAGDDRLALVPALSAPAPAEQP